ILLAVTTLAACNMLTTTGQDDARPPGVFDQVRSIDLLPRQPRPVEGTPQTADNRRPAEYGGTAAAAKNRTTAAPPTGTARQRQAPQAQLASSGEGYELNFENTPLTTVAKVVLGDILSVGYTIDPRVQGTVSLASGRPVSKSDIAYVLENALRVSNVALV